MTGNTETLAEHSKNGSMYSIPRACFL